MCPKSTQHGRLARNRKPEVTSLQTKVSYWSLFWVYYKKHRYFNIYHDQDETVWLEFKKTQKNGTKFRSLDIYCTKWDDPNQLRRNFVRLLRQTRKQLHNLKFPLYLHEELENSGVQKLKLRNLSNELKQARSLKRIYCEQSSE